MPPLPVYTPSQTVLNSHGIPHLLFTPPSNLVTVENPQFDLNNADYLYSLLPLPVLIGGAGLLATLGFLFAILIRLFLLSCKSVIRRVCPCACAKRCHIFRCCVCCKKGCTHPDSRCANQCCCCYTHLKTISASTKNTMSQKIRAHNKTRHGIVWAYGAFLVSVVITDAFVFYSQPQLSSALNHLSSALVSLTRLFASVIAAATNILADLDHIVVAIATSPCTPFIPQQQQSDINSISTSLKAASNNIQLFSAPVVAQMAWLSSYLTNTIQPAVDRCIITFFLGLLVVTFIYALGEHLQYRVLMRIALFLSAIIVLALTATCSIVMVIVVLLGDFCVDPTRSVLSLLGNKDSILYRELKYYITCEGTNPFSLDLSTSVVNTILLNSSVNSISQLGLAPPSCVNDLFSSSRSVLAGINSIQEDLACPRVFLLWNEAVEVAFCTDGICGLVSLWLTFFVVCSLLFFTMILCYVFYTWFIQDDVVGTGWFVEDEEGEEGEEEEEEEYVIDLGLDREEKDGDRDGGGDGKEGKEDKGDEGEAVDLLEWDDGREIELTFTHGESEIEYRVHATPATSPALSPAPLSRVPLLSAEGK